MKNIKLFIYLAIVWVFSNSAVLATVTAGSPSNLIKKIATASSFTATNQSSAQNASQIQATTSKVINPKEIKKTVQEDAKKFGLLINEAALSNLTGEESDDAQLVLINGEENIFEGSNDLKPNIDTIVYDTGLMTLTKEGGHYNDDTSNTIFSTEAGAQQARIKVYVDFKRKVLFGEIESRITLTGASQMINTKIGGAKAIVSLPIDGELTHTVVSSTGGMLSNINEPYAWLEKHTTTSLIRADGSLAPYYDNSERLDMQKNVSHGTGGDGNVYVGARFITEGEGTLGQSTASFEASHAAANASATDFVDDKVVRYSATATPTATSYNGELPK